MRDARVLAAAIGLFVVGVAAVWVGMSRYDDAFAWVAHTSDVRLVIGRAVGHAGHAPSCDALRVDAVEFARLTSDNPIQQAQLGALDAGIDRACAGGGTLELVELLARLDTTERELMAIRRERLAHVRAWTLAAFALSSLVALAVVLLALRLQRRAQHHLVESEERFRMLASSSRDLVRVHEPSGRPIYASPSFAEVLGYTPQEIVQAVPLSLGHPDDLAKMRATLEAIQQPGSKPSTLVYRLRAKDGSYRWFETHTNPIHDRHGKLLRFYTLARDVTQRMELERRLEAAAVTDELTGLLNRRGFMMVGEQELRIALRQRLGVAVLFADVDGLKAINDELGHDHGDRAIRALANVLRATFRESDVVARLGGDEFAILAYNLDQAHVDTVVARVRAAVRAAPPIGQFPLSASIGFILLEAGATARLEDLLEQADRRMYEVKRARES